MTILKVCHQIILFEIHTENSENSVFYNDT